MRHLAFAVVLLAAGAIVSGDDSNRVLTIDHYVRVKSTVPAIAGQDVPIYARERVLAGEALRGGAAPRVALFVHGAGTPAEVAFDVPQPDYSWMEFLARAGWDVFAMDTTGYGRSFRPAAMNDPCNLPHDRQAPFVKAPCPPAYAHALTTIASDWNDIDAVVDYVRALRRVDRVSLIAWSLGGPRAGGYAAQHPDKVQKLVLLAPAYNRNAPAEPPAKMPPDGVPMNTQSRDEFYANWDRQVGCTGQYDPSIAEAVWSQLLASDPIGATWGPGVRRAPQTATWGWNAAVVAKMQTPTMMVAGQYDKQVAPDRVKDFYADLGAPQKLLVDLACSSHNAMWEKNRLLLFRASLEWLTGGTVNGAKEGTLRLGY
jgi:pimeloyl-ACP methyl ester carboxylesterase